jgi:hypothetical protein
VGEPPTNSAILVDKGLLANELASDGWDSLFRIDNKNGQIAIISPGSDQLPFTKDDITLTGTQLLSPPEFENFAIEMDLEQ